MTQEERETCYDLNRSIEKAIDELALRVLRKFNELETTEYVFPKEHDLHSMEFVDDKIVHIYYESIKVVESDFNMIEMFSPYDLLRVKLSNGEDIGISEIPVRKIGLFLSCLNSTLDWMIEDAKKPKLKDKRLTFDNKTVLITDPCYIMKSEAYKCKSRKSFMRFEEFAKEKYEEWEKSETMSIPQILDFYKTYDEYKEKEKEFDRENYEEPKLSDWDKCSDGDFSSIGIKNAISNSTIYGDWSCHTFNSDTTEVLGEFCADAGLVAVFDYDEVLAYNPDFENELKKHPHIATLIPGFTGDVYFDLEHTTGVYEEDTQYHKKGEPWEDYSLHVVGKGNINFVTRQTGL